MEIAKLKRVFSYNNEILPDPNPNWTPKEVVAFYTKKFPELTNFKTEPPSPLTLDSGETVICYEISAAVGTLG